MEWNPLNWLKFSTLSIPITSLSTGSGVVLLIILFLSLIYLRNHFCDNFPPGPWGYPIIGNLKLLQDKPHLHLTYLKEKYGDVYSLQLGRYRTVVVCSLDGIQEGLVKNSPMFSGRSSFLSNRELFNGHSDGGEAKFTVNLLRLSLVSRKPIFRVSDQVRLKSACSVKEAS